MPPANSTTVNNEAASNSLNKAQEKIRAAYLKRTNKTEAQAAALPWAKILEFLMSLLGGCFTMRGGAKGVREAAQNDVIRSRIAVRRGMRQSGLLAREDADALEDCCIELAKESSEQELEEFNAVNNEFFFV